MRRKPFFVLSKCAKIKYMDMKTGIATLNRVGKTTASRLKRLGLNKAGDLVYFFPFRYEDYSNICKISDLRNDEPVTVKVRVELIANRRSWKTRKTVTEALVSDDTGQVKVIWFNQPFLTKNIKQGERLFLSGKFDALRQQFTGPEYEKISGGADSVVYTARILPVYHTTENVTQKQLRFLISQLRPLMKSVEEFLPKEILKKYDFPELAKALQRIHFPENLSQVTKARKRLEFQELFLIQLAVQKMKMELQNNQAHQLKFREQETKEFVEQLPYQLTKAQKKCGWEIIQDLQKDKPMNRLLEGDVGAGKTIVVALGILNTLLNKKKVILMAPTEILATQHYDGLNKIFAKQLFRIGLLTGSRREINGKKFSKEKFIAELERGGVDLLIGTHAVIQDKIVMKDLALVIVDEQHRFGVAQRKALLSRQGERKQVPHFLSMTATPIPRSLVLTLYGDLELSVIDEMPPGRKPIITKLVKKHDRPKAYAFIEKQISESRQAFVICPLIDPSDKLAMKSVLEEYERLQKNIFPNLRVGLMHGRLKAKEKESVMKDFYDKQYDILVSTSVIEVGIDVPNASIMMIEGADRFGLAQLHQFRGRVGRGQYQSYCFLFTENTAPESLTRLKYMETYTDGFQLAEKDLQLRGPGEVYGVKQSGLPELKLAKLNDVKLIKIAQKEAGTILSEGDLNSALQEELSKAEVSMHFE